MIFKRQMVGRLVRTPIMAEIGVGFAPSNLALIKYWGKRDAALNLPWQSSLSVSLGYYGTVTILRLGPEEKYHYNGQEIRPHTVFASRIKAFLDLFRLPGDYFELETRSNLPLASGFASSASGFAALTLALNELCGWQADLPTLSIIARLGSGSACRSLEHGFVSWWKGERDDGLDSWGEKIADVWPELRLGLLTLDSHPKKISSRDAMSKAVHHVHYIDWCRQAEQDWQKAKTAVLRHDFQQLADLSEKNSAAMHSLIGETGINYSNQETFRQIMRIKELRRKGMMVFYTQDAGANLMLLTASSELTQLCKHFPLKIINPRVSEQHNQVLSLESRVVPKIKAHTLGTPHWAFSVIIYRSRPEGVEFLIQQRSITKYHTPNLWSNTCCGHPIGDFLVDAQQRLMEEMGFTVPLKKWGELVYRAELGLFKEYEHDYLYWGDGGNLVNWKVNGEEVEACRWVNVWSLIQEMKDNPEKFTPWFHKIMEWLKLRWETWVKEVINSYG